MTPPPTAGPEHDDTEPDALAYVASRRKLLGALAIGALTTACSTPEFASGNDGLPGPVDPNGSATPDAAPPTLAGGNNTDNALPVNGASSVGAPPEPPTPAPGTPSAVGSKGAPFSPPVPALKDPHVIHLANRLTFGVTPELRSQIAADSNAFIEDQLAKSGPDPDLEAEMSILPAINIKHPKLKPSGYHDKHVSNELAHTNVLRAVRSKHQLYEMVVQLWMDHFNISHHASGYVMNPVHYQERTIRPNAMGKFRDLLVATAHATGMLVYLNLSGSNANSPQGVNENYGRELLELHTLGIRPDGSKVYNEDDIKAAALVMSGWGERHNKFYFNNGHHYQGDVSLLNGAWTTGDLTGKARGDSLLEFLATHESTARHIAYKLGRRFISDNPPQSIINSTAKVFLENDTAIVPTLRHLFNSEEFRSSSGQKFRRPLEYLAASLRALKIEPSVAFQNPVGATLRVRLDRMNHRPWLWEQPDGYSDYASDWMNAQAMVARWTIAAELTNDIRAQSGVVVDELKADYSSLLARVSTADELISTVADEFGVGELDPQLRADIAGFAGLNPDSPVAGLPQNVVGRLVSPILSHPNFQIR